MHTPQKWLFGKACPRKNGWIFHLLKGLKLELGAQRATRLLVMQQEQRRYLLFKIMKTLVHSFSSSLCTVKILGRPGYFSEKSSGQRSRPIDQNRKCTAFTFTWGPFNRRAMIVCARAGEEVKPLKGEWWLVYMNLGEHTFTSWISNWH